MGVFDRLAQVWKGFLNLWISDIENKNPEAVYEAAIEERIAKHRQLKKAVSGIVYLRNKTSSELETKERELAEINLQLPIAVEEGEDEVALVLIEKQESLESRIGELRLELTKISEQAEESKRGLLSFQAEIGKLKREKVEMLAKKASAEARIQIQDTLNGLSTEADIKALDNIRENINQLQAEADVGTEVSSASIDDKLAGIKARAATMSASRKLEQMKKLQAAKKAAAVKKTM